MLPDRLRGTRKESRIRERKIARRMGKIIQVYLSGRIQKTDALRRNREADGIARSIEAHMFKLIIQTGPALMHISVASQTVSILRAHGII